MRTDLRVVLDANVLISAVLKKRSIPRRVFDEIKARGVLLFSTETFSEFTTRVERPKFDRYSSWTIGSGSSN